MSERKTIEVWLQCSVQCRVSVSWDHDEEYAVIHAIGAGMAVDTPMTDCLPEHSVEDIDNAARKAFGIKEDAEES